MRSVIFTSLAASTTYIAAAQTLGAAGNMLINGSGVDANTPAESARVVIPLTSGEYKVTLTSTGNISGVNFTVTGRNLRGDVVTETLAGPNNNTVSTTAYFSKITSIAADAAVATNTSAGIGIGRSNFIKIDPFIAVMNVTTALDVTGTINVTVKYTADDPELTSSPLEFDHTTAALVSATADAIGSLTVPHRAQRIYVNSGTGTVVGTVIQQGVV